MNLEELKNALQEINNLKSLLQGGNDLSLPTPTNINANSHPMLHKRCICRTYSAGVHIGTITYINPENSMEVKLEKALRLWKWEDGGLSLSAIATNGITKGRLNRTPEVYLTNVIEMIPISETAFASCEKWVEDNA